MQQFEIVWNDGNEVVVLPGLDDVHTYLTDLYQSGTKRLSRLLCIKLDGIEVYVPKAYPNITRLLHDNKGQDVEYEHGKIVYYDANAKRIVILADNGDELIANHFNGWCITTGTANEAGEEYVSNPLKGWAFIERSSLQGSYLTAFEFIKELLNK